MESLRNIAIVAHVDHGKTTLVSQLMEQTETGKRTDVSELDNNALEKERGITILAKNTAIIWEGVKINLVKLDQAVHFATQLGPAATPYAEATDFKKNSAKEAIKNELSKFENNENITLPGSCWLTIAI